MLVVAEKIVIDLTFLLVQFFGATQDGNTFLLELNICDQYREAYFVLKLKDGSIISSRGKHLLLPTKERKGTRKITSQFDHLFVT